MERMNLHLHTKYSDGIFSPAELIEAAIHYGINVVGFADHYLTTKTTAIESYAEKPYLEEITKLKKRYANVVRIYAGVEIDCSHPEFRPERYNYEFLNNLDFILLEYVNDGAHDGVSLQDTLPMLEKISVPVGLAHNDIGRNFEGIGHDVLAEFLSTHGIFIELDTSRRYRRFEMPYYRIAADFFRDYGQTVKLSIGSDVHAEIDEVANIGDAVNFIKKYNLANSLIF
ncbi:MAG: PHP domain-containing protein [Thermoplasmata archaeon]|nr:PHP domain-containing protein [Thermoplasmata archaeon]